MRNRLPALVIAATGHCRLRRLPVEHGERPTALAVAAAGLAGLDTAADDAGRQANEAAVTNALDRAGDVLVELQAVGSTDGLAQAAESLTQAMENAPEAADAGLDRAMEAVTT
jgi:hypothetical protein